MKSKFSFPFLLFFFCVPIFLTAQKSIVIKTDIQKIVIGDPLSVKIQVDFNGEELLNFPSPKLLIGKNPFELLKQVSSDTIILENKTKKIVNEFLLTSFEPGNYTLGPIYITDKVEGSTDTLYSNQLDIKVLPLKLSKDSTDIKPIRDIWKEEKNWQDWLPILYGLGAVILLTLFIFWWLKRKKKGESIPENIPVFVSPVNLALEKMNWLEKQNFLLEKDFVNYHYELGIIFRSFLEKQFEVSLLDLPTNEVLKKIQTLPILPLITDEIISWMKTADFVKFAKAEPPFSFHEEAFQNIKQFFIQFQIEESSISTENK